MPSRRGWKRNTLPLIARWKILDNLRRSLVGPAALLLVLDGVTGLVGVNRQPEGLDAVVSQEPVYDLYRYLYGDGMRRLTRETCDELAKIPMFGSVESLNVSVATGVCLFEARRQRSVMKLAEG